MAHPRLMEPSIDTYGSRREWKRIRRGRLSSERLGPSLNAVAFASIAVLVFVVFMVLLLSQVALVLAG